MSHLSGGQTSWAPGDGRGPRKRIDDRVRWLLGRGKAVRGRNPHCPAQEKAATEPTDRTEAIKASRGARFFSPQTERRKASAPSPRPRSATAPRRGLRRRALPFPLLPRRGRSRFGTGLPRARRRSPLTCCPPPPPVLVWLLSSRFGGTVVRFICRGV